MRKSGRPRSSRVEQEVEPPLGDRGELGDGDLQEVDGQRDRLAVEVAAGDKLAVLGKDQRVVGDRVRLDLGDAAHVRDRVAHRAVHDRNAAERVRILNAAALGVRLHDLRAGEQRAQVRRRRALGRDAGADR